MASQRRVTIALYALATFLFWMGQHIYVPTLPTYVQTKRDNLAVVGYVLSMYGLWQVFFRLPLGIAVDWLGRRKPFIVVGFAISGVGAWVTGASDSVGGLAFGRGITGIAACSWVPLVVAFSALFPPREAVRASALITFFNSAGRILATAATGALNDWGGYSLAFVVATAIAAISTIIILPIREPRYPSQRPSVESIGRLFARRDVLLPSLISMLGLYISAGVTFGFLPVLAKQMGATDIAQSALVTLNIVLAAFGNLIASASSRRISPPKMLYFGWGLVSVGLVFAAFSPVLGFLFAVPIFLGLGGGLSYPILVGMSIQNVDDSERTMAMSVHQSVYAVGMFAGPALSGAIADALGIQLMFGITLSLCLLALLGTRGLATAGKSERV
jgi:MFS family permease